MTTINDLSSIKWSDFRTAYGQADDVPKHLTDLFSEDKKVALDATHQLWCGLCHQHAYISSAALPSYDILKTALLTLDDEMKIEILDIISGFASCTSPEFYRITQLTMNDWEIQLRHKLILDRGLYEDLLKNPNEEISYFASNIVDSLDNIE